MDLLLVTEKTGLQEKTFRQKVRNLREQSRATPRSHRNTHRSFPNSGQRYKNCRAFHPRPLQVFCPSGS